MKWVRIPTDWLGRKEYAPLPDRLWRLLVELDMLCGQYNGPVHVDWEEIAWLLHRESADVARDTAELLARGLVEIEHDHIQPTGWTERNAAYLAKMEYNRERYYFGKKEEPPVAEETAEAKALWDAIEGNGGRPRKPGDDPIAVLRAHGSTEREWLWRSWAGNVRLLNNAPDNVQQVSWLLYEFAGMYPTGTKKAWASAVIALYEAANGDYELAEIAIKKAAQDRDKRGITLSSPHSFKGYARSEVGRRALSARNGANGGAGPISVDDQRAEKPGAIDL